MIKIKIEKRETKNQKKPIKIENKKREDIEIQRIKKMSENILNKRWSLGGNEKKESDSLETMLFQPHFC